MHYNMDKVQYFGKILSFKAIYEGGGPKDNKLQPVRKTQNRKMTLRDDQPLTEKVSWVLSIIIIRNLSKNC